MDRTDTMNSSSEDGSPPRDLEDVKRTTIYRILTLEQFRMQDITKNKMWPRKDVDAPEKKFKHFQKSSSNRLKQMLEDEVETDCVLIASDGQEMKCHKAVLTAKIPRFRHLFGHENLESITGRVQMGSQMNAEGTTAFLRYLYLHEMDGIVKSFDVASSLIYAGHYYEIPDLINDVALVFKYYEEELEQVRDLEWGSIDKYWDLYDLVRLWEEGHPSKRTVVTTIFGMIKKVWMKSCGTDSRTIETIMETDTEGLTEFVGYLTKTWTEHQTTLVEADDGREYGSRGNRSLVRGRAHRRR